MARKILVVDDVEVNRAILRRILSDDYDVVEARNGREALEVLRHSPESYSAVTLDLVMPEMNGYEVLAQLRDDAALSAIPVIVTTGSTDLSAELNALSLGAIDYITKPYNAEIIRHRLWNTINLRENAAIANAARYDELTGLLNRKPFFDKAAELIAEHEPGYFVLSCFDIDSFKVINDQYGTAQGDAVLRYIAMVFKQGFGPMGGLCCRVMADNFAVLYPCEMMESTEVAEIRRRASVLDGSIQPISFSVGRYIIDDTELSVSAMYDRASIAEASVKGRYDTHIAQYDETMRQQRLHTQKIVTDMKGALEDGQFEVWFQPQYNHATGALTGAEALVRWRLPDGGKLVSPGEFIPVFEQNGFIYELDKFVWERVCAHLRRWLDEGRAPMPVSVNVSRRDMFRADFFEFVTGLISRYELPIDLLRLEITESAFAEASRQIITMVERLVAFGFVVEIDDFGSGYSSLNTLKDVPASVLKLDMRFLEGDGNSSRGGNILESIVRMAKWLDMAIIAEGVETRQQADYLKSIGCNYVQGYYYARPMPLAEYETLSAVCEKEDKYLKLETVESLDNNAFWDPKSLETIVFNTFVGGACIFEYDGETTELLRANDNFAHVLGGEGMSVDKALQIKWKDHMDEEGRRRARALICKGIDTMRAVGDELVLRDLPNAAHHRTYLRCTLRVIARTGKRYLIYCTMENITAQREAERSEREMSELTRLLMNDTPGGFCRMSVGENMVSRLVYANEGFLKLVRMSRDEVMELYGEDASRGVHPDDMASATESYQAAMAGGELRSRYRLRRGRRGYIEVMVFGRMVVTDAGERFLNAYYTDLSDTERREEQARELLDNLPCGAALYDLRSGDVTALYRNEGYRRLLGRKESTAAERPVLDYVHPDDRSRLWREIEDAATQKRDVACDIRIQREGERYRPFRVAGRLIRRGPGRYVSYATFMPITEDEMTLRWALPCILNAIMESTSDLAFAKDKSLRYLCCSRTFAQMAGLENESDIVGKTDKELCSPELYRKYRADDLRLMRDGKAQVDLLEAISDADGMPRYSRTSKYPLSDAFGNIIGVYGVGRDVTQDRDAYLQLKLLTDNIPGGVARYELSPRGTRILYFSDGYFTLTGYTREEYDALAKDDPFCLVFPEDIEVIQRNILDVLGGASTFDYQYRAWNKRGGYSWLGVKGTVSDRRGDIVIVNTVKLDLTEQKRMEERRASEYERLFFDAAVERFAAIVKVNMATGAASRITFEKGAPHEYDLHMTWDAYYRQLLDEVHPDDREKFQEQALHGKLEDVPLGAGVSFTYRAKLLGGAYRWYTTTLRTSPGLGGSATAFTMDINDEMIERSRLKDLSEHDGLTDLFNRVKLESMMETEYRALKSCGVLFFDVNDLKQLNDELGHDVGDEMLCQMAESVRSITNRRIHGYRYGGDEFLVVVCDGKKDELDHLLAMWSERLDALWGETGVRGSVAVGTAWAEAPFSPENLIHEADRDMYRNKDRMKCEQNP